MKTQTNRFQSKLHQWFCLARRTSFSNSTNSSRARAGRPSLFVAVCASLSLLVSAHYAVAIDLTYAFADFTDLSAYTLNGQTAIIDTGGMGVLNAGGKRVLRLTDNLNQSGSAFLSQPISLAANASFSTAFHFQISNPMGIVDVDGRGADGIVFVINSVGNNVGGSGGGIGYLGIPNSIGIEFDTWWNRDGIDPIDDGTGHVDGNHVGVDVNGSVVSVLTKHVFPGNTVRMNNGNVWYVWVDYNGTSQTLEVRLSTENVRPADSFISAVGDLPAILGQTDVYVGFTSGTGGAGGYHDIVGWEFRDDFDPIEQINTSPVARCRNVTVVAGANCQADASVDNGSFDSDPGDTITISQSPTGPYPLGATPVTLTVVDSKGAANSCTATVTVVDTTPPTIVCPTDATVPCDANPLIPLSYSAVATDSCDPAPVVVCSPPSGSLFPVGATLVTCTATDASGNQSTCSFTVTRLPLNFVGFLPPIDGADDTGGSFANPLRAFKLGSTIPVKFQASCDNSPVLTGIHTLQAIKYSSTTDSEPAMDVTPTDAATTGNQFRLTDGSWHFNLSTKTGFSQGTWKLVATLSDGSQHFVWITIKD